MRAIEIRQPGGPEVLVAAQRPDPVPKAGELLIAVTASGVSVMAIGAAFWGLVAGLFALGLERIKKRL